MAQEEHSTNQNQAGIQLHQIMSTVGGAHKAINMKSQLGDQRAELLEKGLRGVKMSL